MANQEFDFSSLWGGQMPEEDLKTLFGRYAAGIASGGSVPIAALARTAGVAVTQAMADLQKLVSRGFFGREAYIDYMRRTLVVPQVGKKNPPRQTNYRTGADTKPVYSIHTEPKKETGSYTVPKDGGKKKKSELFRKGRGWLLAGAVFAFVTALGNLDESLLASLVFAALGIGCLAARGILEKTAIRYRKYLTLVGDRESVSVPALAAAAGVGEKRVYNDLDRMVYKGMFGTRAVVDRTARCLAIAPEAVKAETPEEPVPAPESGDAEFDALLREIRHLDEEIQDEEVSEKIRRIEAITGKIFAAVEENPDKRPQIKSFMSYYLPTTLKLLRSYATFEKQGVSGENIDGAKQNISGILENLAQGFEQQLDKLFQSDVMDISSDIDVLETMMKRDGLGGSEGDFSAGEAQTM